VMLTGKADVNNKVLALNEGADDYITKPFHIDELTARIQALTRRQFTASVNSVLTIHDLAIDTLRKTVKRNDSLILLRRKEYELLEYFVKHAGKIVTRTMILDNLWDSAYDPLANTVDVHIKYLRDKIDKPFPKKLIQTIYGVGYRLIEEERR
jgi:DNA-binding response OmpR family regulator